MTITYCCDEIAEVVGVKSRKVIAEFAFKHFGKENIMFVLGGNIGNGGQAKKLYRLTKDQLMFFLSRSRSNTSRAIEYFRLDQNEVCLMRNEILFSSIIENMLKITDISFKNQYSIDTGCSRFTVDMFIYGSNGCAVVEYDEKYHNSDIKRDKERDRKIVRHLIDNSEFDFVKVVRVRDTSEGFSDAIGKIHRLIHADFFHPVMYS